MSESPIVSRGSTGALDQGSGWLAAAAVEVAGLGFVLRDGS